ncbi:MAG TPA: peptide-methionine (S)-S-oxide reductase MsrA [Verrucomicrobiae bacterium]|nr:peptide-methionine (S)-S-oxide reductase MsrA [Verrucomicrobiae bacterium]
MQETHGHADAVRRNTETRRVKLHHKTVGPEKHFREYVAALIGVVALGAVLAVAQRSTTQAAHEPAAGMETATFAGGCFWSLEAAFRQVNGVADTVVGYTGGTIANPTYETVSSHRVDHLEACRVTFDPAQISYEQLVEYFFRIHSPTTTNYIGSPARLMIFFHNAEQETIAKAAREKWQGAGDSRRPIVIEILPEARFYRAEEYHQHYLEKHGLATCKMQP